jgi:dTDP-4-amino-4,6-dideoxygalactose transaminase
MGGVANELFGENMKHIYLTLPYLLSLDEFSPHLQKTCDKVLLTNGGPFHQPQPDCPPSRDAMYEKLKNNNIYDRRYFCPLISDFTMCRGLRSVSHSNLLVASLSAQRVLCLPIYPALNDDEQNRVISAIHEAAA